MVLLRGLEDKEGLSLVGVAKAVLKHRTPGTLARTQVLQSGA